jgi:hypothetical protein
LTKTRISEEITDSMLENNVMVKVNQRRAHRYG